MDVPEAGVRLDLHGPTGSRRVLRQVAGSLSRIPEGYTAVPYLGFGESDAQGVAALEAAGLEADLPDVNFPHYVTGTTPTAGTVVPMGSIVEIQIGDG